MPGMSTREEDAPEKGPFTAQIVTEHFHMPGPGLGVKGLKNAKLRNLDHSQKATGSHRHLAEGERLARSVFWTQRCPNLTP